METYNYNEITIGEIVADDFRTAEIFRNAGIDFCCGGKKSVLEACIEKAIDPSSLEKELKKITLLPVDQEHNFKDWGLDFLCDYIINVHHQYVLNALPDLVYYTAKIANVHGDRHPELLEIAEIFQDIHKELLQHLKKEEEVLFPAIKEVLKNNSREAKASIISEIERMNAEHEIAGGAMDKINMISSAYYVPSDGCNTYQVAFKLLRQFEDDLHIHVHLENNILYPKALKIASNN